MEFIIIFLILIIIILLTYLFLLNKELERIPTEIKKIRFSKSNKRIHSNYTLKNLDLLILQINQLIDETSKREIEYNHKNQSLMKMMTNISHDLRTPLTSALGYIDLLLKSDLPKEEKEKELKIIEARLKKLESLINSFFEFSKIISNNQSPKISKVNLNKVLEESIVGYYEDYEKENREILFSCKENKIIINSNELFLKRIFDNLIGNAYKHSNSNLDIKVTINKSLKIEFKNILHEKKIDIDRIFEEFYTVDISRTKGGTGLGLAIAKEFTEQLGGKISARIEKNFLIIKVEFPHRYK